MKLITKDTDYAIKTLCYLAEQPAGIVSVDQLSETLDIPRPFLRNILQQLNKAKFLRSYKGKSGGFELAIKPQNILVADVAEVFQGRLGKVDCLAQGEVCPDVKTCRLRSKLRAISQMVTEELTSISIASLVTEGGGKS